MFVGDNCMTDNNKEGQGNDPKLMKSVGPWVDKDRFWNREAELNALTELLKEGANIMITAPRRIGKTSLIRQVENVFHEEYICLQLDLQKCRSAADVITELSVATRPHLQLWGKTKSIFGNIFTGVGKAIDSLNINDLSIKIRDGLLDNWQNKGTQLIEAMAEADKPVVVFMDEFPLVVNRLLKGEDFIITPQRIKETDTFLSWVRSLTIEFKGKVSLVITGSIGLEPILRQGNLSHTVNTFTPFELEPWDADTAMGCLRALANNYDITYGRGALKKIVQLLGLCIPHHVQMFFSNIYDDCRRRKDNTCRASDVERVFKTRMLSTRGHAELSTYEERLTSVLGNQQITPALELLTEAAVNEPLTIKAANIICAEFYPGEKERNKTMREIIGILEHDGYLVTADKGYVFASKLIKDWWRARFGFQYIPAQERE